MLSMKTQIGLSWCGFCSSTCSYRVWDLCERPRGAGLSSDNPALEVLRESRVAYSSSGSFALLKQELISVTRIVAGFYNTMTRDISMSVSPTLGALSNSGITKKTQHKSPCLVSRILNIAYIWCTAIQSDTMFERVCWITCISACLFLINPVPRKPELLINLFECLIKTPMFSQHTTNNSDVTAIVFWICSIDK